ncbi:unnamed protein product, partial [Porites lobata]
LLSNTKKNDSNKDIIFNQQSIVRSAPAFDIDFDYSPDIAASESSSSSVQPATTITLEQVPTLKINQKVNVTATISLGSEQPKPVEVKSTQKMTLVKEDCVLEDETEIAGKEIWLTAFTKEIESLLALSPELSLMSDSESIEDHLMDLKDIHFTYNVNKNTITQVTSLSNGLAQ